MLSGPEGHSLTPRTLKAKNKRGQAALGELNSGAITGWLWV